MFKSIINFFGVVLCLVLFWLIIFYCVFKNVMLPQVHISVSQNSCVQVVEENVKDCSVMPEKYHYVYVE